MRILWHANAPWAGTGYGQQTAVFAPRIRDLGHDVFLSAFYGLQGQASVWNNITVLPGGLDGWGNDIISAHVKNTQADLMIVLADAWPLNPEIVKPLPAAMWMPVDTATLGAADEKMLRESGAVPIAISQHGHRQLLEAGFTEAQYVPHGIDTSIFKPPADRAALRKQWGVEGRFVIGMNAANKDGVRKAYSEQFHAFAPFYRKHPEAVLLVHALPRMPGNQLDLEIMAKKLGIAEAVRFSDQYAYVTGAIQPASLAEWYGILDVLSSASYGEGFGIPIVEAQACGTPVIVTRGSAMTELCGAGWQVGGQPFWNPVHCSDWTVPNITEITRAYEKAFTGAAGKRAKARAFAVGYDADLILLDYWKPVLERIKGIYDARKVAAAVPAAAVPAAIPAAIEAGQGAAA